MTTAQPLLQQPGALADPSATQIGLAHDKLGRLVLTMPDGQSHIGVHPVRCFPFTAPLEWISFCDARGAEVHCLPTLEGLSGEARSLLEAELARREFIPVVRRVREVSPGAEPTTWLVETDRGEARFTLPSEDNVRRLGAHGALITDAHGVRFRIHDTRTLDARSRRFLVQYL
ncbi:MAG: DUF1854 domain-containing protein [Deltaproteobacteria bacterium]|nr:DUF1854 domain-containing protein [Deltaproteobacteria bacterium]